MQQPPRAFKRITAQFTHEVEGQRKPDSLDFVRECNSVAYGQGVLESFITEFLTQAGVVKPEVTDIDSRLSEPPLFLI